MAMCLLSPYSYTKTAPARPILHRAQFYYTFQLFPQFWHIAIVWLNAFSPWIFKPILDFPPKNNFHHHPKHNQQTGFHHHPINIQYRQPLLFFGCSITTLFVPAPMLPVCSLWYVIFSLPHFGHCIKVIS